ncbi:MAG: hypothetical protein CUN49_10230 [Candidatus Thermofonsia Clade 1 bacterium]|uniref:Class I SAM-dependent methyltransferase n=1 Tax=Candidatus Thermofonsia Clade 1 bacterium TaxID=2364210 RepID=A0A2M8PD70_9CHLR|nr:MAG: hypothetical protein CUN49_10230 [Candidatus Thermofonsia Clade 1 bacterium]
MLNPLDYPVIFLDADYRAPSAWWQHTPFARFLVALTRPSVLVELGTHYGVSYFAFCQAVKALGLHTRCYAVDTWQGDEQAGFYGEEVFDQVNQYNEQSFAAFSRLLRMTFDEALSYFDEGEIDLLHIDGYHAYEAVQHDYSTWLPKMSPRGIILFHDINVREGNFGVWRLWNELSFTFPHFELLHGHGLGVLAVGTQAAEQLSPLLSLSEEELSNVRFFFSQLGQRVTLQIELHEVHKKQRLALKRLKHLKDKLVEYSQLLLSERKKHLEDLERARMHMQYLEQDLQNCSQHRQAERETYVAEIERARSHMHQLEAELTAQLQHRQAERETYVAEIERARSHMHQLEAELTAHIAQLQSERAAHTAEIEQARAHIQHIEQESHARALHLRQAEESLAGLQQALDEQQRSLEQTRNEADSLAQRIVELEERCSALQAEMQDNLSVLEARLADLEAQRDALKAQLAASEAERDALEAQLAEAQAALAHLERKLHAYRVLD